MDSALEFDPNQLRGSHARKELRLYFKNTSDSLAQRDPHSPCV